MNVSYLIERLENNVRALPEKPGKSYEMSKMDALQQPWLQINRNGLVEWLVIDIDEPGAAHLWEDVEVPPPNFVVINPENQHAQYFYHIKVPVYSWFKQRRTKAYRYLKAIYDALVRLLKGDQSCGLHGLRKNPVHGRWIRHDIHVNSFALDDFADYLDLTVDQSGKHAEMADEQSRNCYLFNAVRLWAYKQAHTAKTISYDRWYTEVFYRVSSLNNFKSPLPTAEVKSISKSIAVYIKYRYRGALRCFRDRNKHGPGMTTREKQVIAANETNRIRTENTLQKLTTEVQDLKRKGCRITIAALSKKTGLHRNTISRYRVFLAI